MLKIYHPAYRVFSCLGGECHENCCRVFRILFFNWEQKLFSLKDEWQDADGHGLPLTHFIHYDDGECSLDKTEDGKCVFLTGDGMCSLQKRYGIGALPSVCRTYPRLITRLPDRTEYALDPCCAEVLRLMKGWIPGELDIEGGEEPSDPEYLVRKQAMALLAEGTIDIKSALEGMAALYHIDWTCPDVSLSESQISFLRCAVAATIWAYAFAYFGHPKHPRPLQAITEFLTDYIPHLALMAKDDWNSLSADYSGALSDFVKMVRFDDEIETRYVDMLQD